jgi:isopentenyl-diphosphate delta-isomerase
MVNEDDVVLLADSGEILGRAPRESVHGTATPLHLAYSCYVLDAEGRVLLTRRALSKRSWPGVWTNAFCGHPRPGERIEDAVHRGAAHELGATIGQLRRVLPDFRYRAVDAAGVVENEVCPVFVAQLHGTLRPEPTEVAQVQWVAPESLATLVRLAPWTLSPWAVAQLSELDAAGTLVDALTPLGDAA